MTERQRLLVHPDAHAAGLQGFADGADDLPVLAVVAEEDVEGLGQGGPPWARMNL